MAKDRSVLGDLRLIAFDVDGVFTDGRFYLSDAGVESKSFSTQDGFGLRRILDAGIAVAVISGRQSVAVENRMAELGVRYVIQGCENKVAAFDRLVAEMEIDRAQTAYVGDDIPDLPLLRRAGTAIAVANAVDEVKAECDLVTNAAGGHGAVREICDLVLASTADRQSS